MNKQIHEVFGSDVAMNCVLSASPLGRILVVDDEAELRAILVESLHQHGYDVTGCASGSDALAELEKRDFDLLLTDLMMPEMDGIALLKAALEIDPQLIGVMVTGQGTIQTAVDAMQVGAFDYVLKPFRLQSLLPVLTRALNTRQLRLENLQLRETIAIHELSQTISFTLEPHTVMSKLTEAALEQTAADEVSVLLPTSDGKEFYVAAARGEHSHRLLGERIPFDRSISSWVARERTPVILNGEVNDERFEALWPRPAIRSSVSVPMVVGNKLVGVLNLNITSRRRPFALGQMKALSILAGVAAAALESAYLDTKVRATEEKYRSIFDNATEGLFQSTPDGRLLTANPALARILGYDSPEQVIANITDISHQLYVNPEDRVTAGRLQEEAGKLVGFEMEAYRKGGDKIWITVNRRAVRGHDGEVVYFEGSFEEITQRKLAEEALKQSESQLAEAQRLAHIGSWNWDLQKNVHTWSDEHYSIFGINRGDLDVSDDDSMFAFIHPEDRELVRREAAKTIETKVPFDFDYRIVRRDGEERTIHSSGNLEADGQGRPIRLFGTAQDVTERERIEHELRQSEERYRDLVENAQDLIYEHDLQGNYTACNKAGRTMTGYSLEETLELNLAATVAPEYLAKGFAMLQRKLAGESVTAYDLVVIGKDGRRVPVEVNTRLVFKDGVPVGVQGIARDITERKRVEEELRESEERYRLLFESNPQPMWVYDLESLGFLAVNEAAVKHYGYSREEFLGMTIKDIRPAEDISRLHDSVATSLEGIDNAGSWRHLKSDGTLIDVEITSHLLRFDGRRAELILAHDITERRKAESRLVAQYVVTRALAQSNTLNEGASKILQAVCQSAGWEYGALWTVDRGTNVLACAQVWRAPGMEAEEFERVSRQLVFAPGVGLPGRVWNDDAPVCIEDIDAEDNFPRFASAVNAGFHGGCGFPIKFRSEILGIVEFLSCSIRKPDADLLAMMVTIGSQIGQFIERKRVEEALGTSEEQLRQSQKLEAVGQLAGGVAHDFNNLLTVIGGYSSLLLTKLPQESPHLASVAEIKKASDRASALTRQLLAFSRKQILQPKVLDLNVVISDLEKMLRRLIGEDIDLWTVSSPDLGKVKADPGQIEQVLLNLIVNSRDAMPQGGKLTIETRNIVHSEEYGTRHGTLAGKYVMLAVTDSGCGMDAATLARIFEPFFTTKDPGKGTGLGLATVYGIVKQSGGNIWVYSEEAGGTTFKIYLPRVDEVIHKEDSGRLTLIPCGTETVLVVEDEDQVRAILTEILEGQGYQVLSASAGEQAITIAQDFDLDIKLLITDVVMPHMSGRELAARVTEIRPNLPVLFMSGYTDDAIVRHGLLDEKLNFIQKPFDSAGVARKVREVLDFPVRKADE